jgi:copper transport protein
MRRLGAAAAIACVLVGAWALPAGAHASLEATEPADGARLPAGSPPAAVTLRFTEGVQIPDGAVVLLDAEGSAVPGAGAAQHGGRDSIVTAALPSLADGTYVVDWHVVSTDSHPIEGAFTFDVGEPSADEAAVAGLLRRDGGRGVGIAFGVTRALAFGAVLVLIGAAAFVGQWRDATRDRGVRALLWTAWAVALVTAPVGVALQAAYTNRGELDAAWDADALGDVVDSRFGQAWLGRVVLLLVAVPLLARVGRRPTRVGLVLGVVLAVALVATITAAGHARSGRWTALAGAVDVVHLGAAAVWLGGLAVFVVLLCRPSRPRGTAAAGERFSALAAPAVAVIVATGVVQSLRQTDGLESLVDTTYGRLLLAKIAVVALIVIAATASREILLRAMQRAVVPAGPGAARVDTDADAVRDLRQAVVLEVVFATVVLALTAVLVNTEPARGVVADEARGDTAATELSFELSSEELDFDVFVFPARTGENQLHVVTRPAGGADPVDVVAVEASLTQPARDLAPIELQLAPIGVGTYHGIARLPFAGEWQLELRALRTDIDQEVVSTVVPIR